ncbi:PREDICTED: uncharacterized protein LOC109593523, partial [Amphimedon queenslandica]|uniref:Uncharacterized protein n=2 Tax=Amphimedon queenslandica TaxID=400682 RepID=A0AAN0K3M4_AMPQE
THDLNLTLINIASNSVCVQFQFVNGSTLYIDYIHIIDSQGQFHWDDLKPLNDSLNFIKCFDGIPAGNNLTLHACQFETFFENCISNPPAVITGINITSDSTSSVRMSSVHSLVPTTSAVSATSSASRFPRASISSSIDASSSLFTSSSFVSSSSMVTDCMIRSTVTVTRDDCNTFGTKKSQNKAPVAINSCTNSPVLNIILGVFLILSLMINVITLTVCYCKRIGKNGQSSQEQKLSSVDPQYENVHLPVPQSELSMEECAAYGVVEGSTTKL